MNTAKKEKKPSDKRRFFVEYFLTSAMFMAVSFFVSCTVRCNIEQDVVNGYIYVGDHLFLCEPAPAGTIEKDGVVYKTEPEE